VAIAGMQAKNWDNSKDFINRMGTSISGDASKRSNTWKRRYAIIEGMPATAKMP
jgi:hypothetical protein